MLIHPLASLISHLKVSRDGTIEPFEAIISVKVDDEVPVEERIVNPPKVMASVACPRLAPLTRCKCQVPPDSGAPTDRSSSVGWGYPKF